MALLDKCAPRHYGRDVAKATKKKTTKRRTKRKAVSKTCDAKTRAGTPCALAKGWGTDHAGHGRCKLHGGSSPRGRESPHFKHGRDIGKRPGETAGIDPEALAEFRKGYDAHDVEKRLSQLAFVAERMAQEPDTLKCEECGHKMPSGVPKPEWLRAMDILLRAETTWLKVQEKITIHRVLDEKTLVPILEAMVELVNEHITDGAARDKLVKGLGQLARNIQQGGAR